jgi:hypothetical protein
MNIAAPELSIQYNWGRATTFYILYHTSRSNLGHCYLKAVNLNLGRRCGQTEIVCHWSLHMSLALAEQSIQLLTCHISRWRLCHRSTQDNQSESWKRCDLCLFCHWPLLMPLAPAGQSIQLLICHISRRRLCHPSPQDKQSNSWKRCDLCLFCHWPLLIPLAPAGQSIQLLICHISRRRLCHCSPQDNQSKSWKGVNSLLVLSKLSLFVSVVFSWT